MAQLEAFETGDYGPHASWWKMHRGHTRSWPHEENDWTRMELPSSRPSPRHRRWDEIHRPAYSAYSAAPSSIATSRQRPAVTRAASVLLSSPSGMRHHSSDTPLLGRPPAVPSFPRASTAPTGKAAFQNYNPRARPDLRRAASHRDLSPRSAAHYFRSTPDSRRSMRSSLSESDNETDLTRPTPEEDDEDEDDHGGRGITESIFVDKQTLRDRMDIRKHLSQEYTAASSGKQRSSRQSQKQKQKHRGRIRGDDLEQDEEDDEASILQQEQQDYQQRSPQKRSHHRHRSRRSSGSRGAGGGSSSRGRRHESVIPEEAAEEQQVDADTEMDNDVDDDDRRRRRTPSRHTRRSVSRHTAATQDVRRDLSRSKSRLRHADSDEFNPRASSRRPTKRYCESELPDQYASGPATLRRAQTHPTAPSHVTAPPSIDSSKKPSSLFESPLGFGSHAFPTEKSSKRNSCLECMDEFSSSRLAKLNCGHRMCTPCLKKKFKASMTDKRKMPPRCCTMDAIALKHVEKLFDTSFKQAWNHQFREVSVARRIYCPSPRCGQWIKPENMFRGEDNREVAVCGRCHTRVCCLCNNKVHASHDCPRDGRTMRFLAEVEGRQTCYKCKSEVELEEGHNHMICQCGAESCMICGSKWGHCDCPVFDFDTDRAGYGHLQYPPTSGSRHDRFGSAPAITTRDFRPSNASAGRPYSAGEPMRSRPQSSYEDKSRLRSHRDDYRADEFQADAYRDNDLARRMEAFGGLDDGDDTIDAYGSAIQKERLDRYARRHANDDMGAHARHRRSFMGDDDDDDYPTWAATDILPSVPQPPPAPPTPPQQQAQAPPAQHRYPHQQPQQPHSAHQQHQQHPQHPQHQQHHPLHPHHEQHEQHQRPPPPPSQYPAPAYDRLNAPADYYANGLSRTRAVHTDSQVGRLANRFNTDSRSSPMHRSTAPPALPGPPMTAGMPLGVTAGPGGGMGVVPMGPMSPNGPMPPMPPMPPMVSMQGPPQPPPPPPLMGAMPMMSMAPIPPPGMMSEMPMMQRHPMEDDMFMNYEPLRHGRSSEQIPFANYPDEDEYIFGSGGGGRRHRRRDEGISHAQEARKSEMAGLAGLGRGMDRVPDWIEFVGNEPPGMDPDSVLNP